MKRQTPLERYKPLMEMAKRPSFTKLELVEMQPGIMWHTVLQRLEKQHVVVRIGTKRSNGHLEYRINEYIVRQLRASGIL